MSKYTENFPNLSTYDFDTIMCQLRQVCGADPGGLINAQFLSRPTTTKDIALLLHITYELFQSQVELQKQFVELYTFVKDFFENLDLQEEVNQWLNDAKEDGSLAELIGTFVNYQFVYDNYNDLISSDLPSNSKALILGYNNINDGGITLFKKTEDNFDVINGLYINPVSYGCFSDGSSDISDIVNSLINTYGVLERYPTSYIPTIKFPKGRYRIDKGIQVTKSIKIDFGWSYLFGNATRFITVSNDSIQTLYGIDISNFIADGTDSTTFCYVLNASEFRMHDGLIYNFNPNVGSYVLDFMNTGRTVSSIFVEKLRIIGELNNGIISTTMRQNCIRCYSPDSLFNELITINYKQHFIIGGSCQIKGCHSWNTTGNYEAVMISTPSNIVGTLLCSDCVCDTLQIFDNMNSDSTHSFVNCKYYMPIAGSSDLPIFRRDASSVKLPYLFVTNFLIDANNYTTTLDNYNTARLPVYVNIKVIKGNVTPSYKLTVTETPIEGLNTDLYRCSLEDNFLKIVFNAHTENLNAGTYKICTLSDILYCGGDWQLTGVLKDGTKTEALNAYYDSSQKAIVFTIYENISSYHSFAISGVIPYRFSYGDLPKA